MLAVRAQRVERAFVFVEFNAWLYQGYDDARAALMDVIASKLEDEAKARETAVDKVAGLIKRIRWLRAAKLVAGTTASLAFGLGPPLSAIILDFVGEACKCVAFRVRRAGLQPALSSPSPSQNLRRKAEPCGSTKDQQLNQC